MENPRRHKTKQEFSLELGMSRSTLYLRMHELKWKPSGELLCPTEQDELREALNDYKRKRLHQAERKHRTPLLKQIDTD